MRIRTHLFFLALVLILWALLVGVSLGQTVTYTYDDLNRLTRVTYDNGMQISYSYDEAGNRTRRVSTLMADASVDGSVNFQDFAKLASRWLEEDCGYPDDWCAGADINWSGEANWADLSILAQQWLDSIGP